MDQEEKLETIEQMTKLFDAYNVLVNNYMHHVPPVQKTVGSKVKEIIGGQSDPEHLPICERPILYGSLKRFSGLVEGRIAERWTINRQITQAECVKIADGVANRLTVHGSGDHMNKIRAFFAHNTEFIEQAFDIALHDKPLPQREYQVTGEGIHRV